MRRAEGNVGASLEIPLLEFKTRIKAFSHRYNSEYEDKPVGELELAEVFLNGLDPDRCGSFYFYAYIKNKQSETCDEE